jgi:hypothetical protein
MGRIRLIREITFKEGTHCGGWNSVVDACKALHDPKATTIFDDFVEVSFLDQNPRGHTENSPWCGIIHRPRSVQKLPQLKEFLQRLPACRMLFTLTEDLSQRLMASFHQAGIDPPNITVLTHPTNLAVPQFQFSAFYEAPAIISVGTTRRRFGHLKEISSVWPRYYVVNFKEFCAQIRAEVGEYAEGRILIGLPSDAYNHLLCKSLVFLHFEDAAASNTVLECIARAVPLLVNPLPGIVEYLGAEYPLYYCSVDEASRKASDFHCIEEAHKYLVALDRSRFQLNSFIQQLSTSLGHTNVS